MTATPSSAPLRSTGVTILLTLAGFLLFSLMVFYMYRLSGPVEDPEVKRVAERLEFLRNVKARDAEALGTYGWVDPSKRAVRIPIERAMQLVVDRLRAKPLRSADLIVVPGAVAPAPSPGAKPPSPVAVPSTPPPSFLPKSS